MAHILQTKNKDASIGNEKKPLPFISKVFRGWTLALLCAAVAVTGLTAALTRFEKPDDGALVIVLDPGHGGVDTGATNLSRGLYESDINLKIALACRDELQRYDGAKVYMTHTGVRSQVAKATLSSRVSVAEARGADIFISLHTNSAENHDAAGAEIYVPITTHEPKYNEECTRLAEKMLDNLQALGLTSRGVKTRASSGGRVYTFADGTTEIGDYYYVIGEPISRMGIPGMLVEHAFIDGDADFLDTDAELAAIGRADARAIAAHFGLTLHGETPVSSAFDDTSSRPDDVSSQQQPDDTSSLPPESSVSSDVISSAPAPDDISSQPPAPEKPAAVRKVERLIEALPDIPDLEDGLQISEARKAFTSLSETQKDTVEPSLYAKLCNTVTAYEEMTHPIRFAVREGSEMSIDRVNGRLLHAETAAQQSGKITVFSLMMEMELYLDPEVPDEYRHDGVLSFRITDAAGHELSGDDTVADGAIMAVLFSDVPLDTLTVSVER